MDLKKVKIVFNHDIDTVSLYDAKINNIRFGGTSGAGTTISLSIRVPLEKGQTYTVVIPPDTASTDGKQLGKEHTFKFTVAQ